MTGTPAARLKQYLLRSPSALLSLLLIAGIVFFRFVYPPVNILSWDVFGYYLYLPASFIYHDLPLHDISWVKAVADKYQATSTLYQLYPAGAGNVIKYSCGMAILNAPAFFTGHAIALVSGYPADGFSLPYQYAFALSGLVYTALGILVFRKVLLHFFSEAVTSAVLIVIVPGTNYFQLTAFDGMLSHNYLFTLYALMTWFTLRWHEKPRFMNSVLLGLSFGLAAVTRPTEITGLIIPVLWGTWDKESLKSKLELVRKNIPLFLLVTASAIIPGIPQLLYWKHVTGQWLFYSYNNPGEGFDFLHPYILQVLFSFRKGWLIYTPVMILALLGFRHLRKMNRALFPAIFLYFLVNLYVVSSWTCWWYAGGSYSSRPLLSSYVLLAIPLGYHIRFAFDGGWRKYSLSVILGLLILLNLFQAWQWAHGIIDKLRMTREYYFAVFGKTSVPEGAEKLLLVDRALIDEEMLTDTTGYRSRTIAFYDFENNPELGDRLAADPVNTTNKILRLTAENPFSPGTEISFHELTSGDHVWIRASVRIFFEGELQQHPASLVVSFMHKGEVYKYRAESILKAQYNPQGGNWFTVSFDYLTPEVRSANDRMKAYFWLQGSEPVYIDDLKMEVFEPVKSR